MNFVMILGLLPDEMLQKAAIEIRAVADALEKKDMDALKAAAKRIADLVLEHLEALGLTPEMILHMLVGADEKWASFFDRGQAS